MTEHTVGTREEWLAARLELLKAEKELTRRNDELARLRQQLPWVRVDKDYKFETTDGTASLRDLFRGRSQLLVHHMMFPGCPSCASCADDYNGIAVHLEHHDVAMVTVSRYQRAHREGRDSQPERQAPSRRCRHERLRGGGRCRVPRLLGLHPRSGRPVGHVPVARSGPRRTQRNRRWYRLHDEYDDVETKERS